MATTGSVTPPTPSSSAIDLNNHVLPPSATSGDSYDHHEIRPTVSDLPAPQHNEFTGSSSRPFPGSSHEISAKDCVIAVMGVTGAGKSTFVNFATRDSSAKIGHSLQSGKPRSQRDWESP